MKLGIDFVSLMSQRWDVFALLDFCASWNVDVLHVQPRMSKQYKAFESLDDDYLKRVKDRAEELGVGIEFSICYMSPTTDSFAQTGTCMEDPTECASKYLWAAVEEGRQALRVAKYLGSPLIKILLGTRADRKTAQPIEAHMESMIGVLRTLKDDALETGVKFAVENHAGDMTARELKMVVEESGPEFVGVCLDAGGNLQFAAESPFLTLDILAPYVLTSHVRDAVVWSQPKGAAVQHVPMGQGSIGIDEWARQFKAKCPNATFCLEQLIGSPPTMLDYLEPEFWVDYPKALAQDFVHFLQLERSGQPYIGPMLTARFGERPPEYQAAMVLQERLELEKSIRYCQEVLGVGEKKR